MPHECVSCGDVFDDGSDEVFDGCPSCGGTKFFYVKQVDGSESGESVPEPDAAKTEPETVAETQTGSGDDRDIVEADSEYERAFGGSLDDGAQESDDPPDNTEPTEGLTDIPSDDAAPGFRRARADEARDELMDQFETIRIVEPGSYELNLMNLYEEDEKIIALQEDGRYQVSLPSALDD